MAFQTTDRNGNAYNFDDQAVGGNRAVTIVQADSAGNKTLLAPGAVAWQVSSDGQKATYRWSIAGVTPIATPTDILVIQGSATKTVRIKRIRVGGFATTAGQLIIELIRRSTAGTLGSAVLHAITSAQHDINDPASTAVMSYVGTANYGTVGTTAGQLGVGRLFLNVAATGPTTELIWDFSTRQDKAIVLRGLSDFLCINGVGATVPTGGELDFEIEAEEDAS